MPDTELWKEIADLRAHQKDLVREVKELREEHKDFRRLVVAVEKIALRTESIEKKVDGMGERLLEVEKEPADNFKHYKRLIVGCIITGILTALLTAGITLILK